MDKKRAEKSNIFGNIIGRNVEGDISCNEQKNFSRSEENNNEYIRDHSSILSLQPWIFRREICQNEDSNMNVNGNFSDERSQSSPRNVRIGYRWGRGRNSLRSRRLSKYFYKPVNSVGNCLIPQLYTEHFEFEEYYASSVHSSARPLVITDGKRVISKSSFDAMGMQVKEEGLDLKQMEVVVGVPSLPELRNLKKKGTSNSPTCKVTHAQDFPSSILLFCLGISIGIISNRKEVERLNDMLKHTENLVQDLQEEMDMKDSLTVKELENEACGSHRLDENYANMKDSTNGLQTQNEKNSEMSRIEAELKAELERLELNMNANSLEGRISTLELDPDLMSDEVQGDLRDGTLTVKIREGHYSDNTSTTEDHDVNYAVSPRELSLRLHEVIQFRLEEQIKELETALHQSQKEIEFMKSDQILCQSRRDFSHSDMGSYNSDPGSPIQPLCLKLDGEALNAYDEAYQEFMLSIDTKSSRRFNRDFSDESDDDDDEEGKKLIQQILEKSKEGSHVVLNAQRLFFAMDE